jgi:toxin ParE1/3/4
VTARELTWTAVARQELAEIGEFIARDKLIAANRWVETLMAAAERAAAMPLAGRRVPEFDRDDLREVIKRGYRIVYLVTDTQIKILKIREGHRRLPGNILDR